MLIGTNLLREGLDLPEVSLGAAALGKLRGGSHRPQQQQRWRR